MNRTSCFCATVSHANSKNSWEGEERAMKPGTQLLSSPPADSSGWIEHCLHYQHLLLPLTQSQRKNSILPQPPPCPYMYFAAWKLLLHHVTQITGLSATALLGSDQEEVGTEQPPSWTSAINPNPSTRFGDLPELCPLQALPTAPQHQNAPCNASCQVPELTV